MMNQCRPRKAVSNSLWPIEYVEDHLRKCREKELARRPFNYTSPQCQYRQYLISWLRKRAEKYKLSISTLHLSVYILDIFMDNHTIEVDRLHLVALVCLLVAAKYEEHDMNIPKMKELNEEVDNMYSLSDFLKLEVLLLAFLDWNLNLPTAAHLAEYYSLFAVSPKDWDPSEHVSYETYWHEVQQTIKYYLDHSLFDLRLHDFLPSEVASACIFLARHRLQMFPIWTQELSFVTKYSPKNFMHCVNIILQRNFIQVVDRKRKPDDSPDTGYISGDSQTTTTQGPSLKRRHVVKKNFKRAPEIIDLVDSQ